MKKSKGLVGLAVRGSILTGVCISFPMLMLLLVFGISRWFSSGNLPWIVAAAVGVALEIVLIVLCVLTLRRFRQGVREAGEPRLSRENEFRISQWSMIAGLADMVALGLTFPMASLVARDAEHSPLRMVISVTFFVLLSLLTGAFVAILRLKWKLNCYPEKTAEQAGISKGRAAGLIIYAVLMIAVLIGGLVFFILDMVTHRFEIIKEVLFGLIYIGCAYTYYSDLRDSRRAEKAERETGVPENTENTESKDTRENDGKA